MRCRISGVSIHRGELDCSGPAPSLSFTYDLIEDASGNTIFHGTSTSVGPWSQDTEEALASLIECVRKDLLQRHFSVDGGVVYNKKREEDMGINALFSNSRPRGEPEPL